ncbi:MAG: protein kinase domain-containing protein [Chloroflexota bacterium]
MMDLPQLGQYRAEGLIDHRLAAAGIAVRRYRAIDTMRKRPVLLSVIERSAFANERDVRRFLEGAQQAADLVHPHLGWLWEAAESDARATDPNGRLYLVERAVQGQLLSEQLAAQAAPFSWPESQQIIKQLAQGLDFAHARGWVHGGLDPADIWLSPDLGAIAGGWAVRRGLAAAGLGGPGSGPAGWLAPEVLAGGPVTAASDQYALASLWFELLAGRPQQREAGQSGWGFPARWPAGAPWQIEQVFERALSSAPSARYPSAGALAATPGKLAIEAPLSAAEQQERLEQAERRREEEEQARQEAEEAVRLAALEQARREIGEQVQRAVAATIRIDPLPEPEPEGSTAAAVDAAGAAPAVPSAAAEQAVQPEAAVESKPAAANAPGRGISASGGAAAKTGATPAAKPPAQSVTAAPASETVTARSAAAPARRGSAVRAPARIVWGGLVIAGLLFGGLWWTSRSSNGTATPTTTPTTAPAAPSATAPAAPAGGMGSTATGAPASGATGEPAQSPTPSATRRPDLNATPGAAPALDTPSPSAPASPGASATAIAPPSAAPGVSSTPGAAGAGGGAAGPNLTATPTNWYPSATPRQRDPDREPRSNASTPGNTLP